MRALFADTFYFLALLNRRDPAHQRAVLASRGPEMTIVTTEFVLLELADALCRPEQRQEVLAVWKVVETDPSCRLVSASRDLVARARKLYADRADKEWPLTDCISFLVMQEHNLTDALTADGHFEQAGFRAVLA